MRKRCFVAALCLVLLFSSCSAIEPKQHSVFAMDTYMSITAYESKDEACELFEQLLLEYNKLWDLDSSDSELSKFNQYRHPVYLSPMTSSLLVQSLDLCEKTGGALDITLLPVTELWGFRTDAPAIPDSGKIQQALLCCGYERIHLTEKGISMDPNTKIDLGAVAKGFAADQIAEQLKQIGCNSAVISLGGNVRTIGTKPDGSPWNVAIQNPLDESTPFATYRQSGDVSIVTSGSYQRNFIENGVLYSHIIDPVSGFPVQNELASVTVFCESGLVADAYSTALFVMGEEKAIEFYKKEKNFDFLLIRKDGTAIATSAIKDRLAISDPNQIITYID